ETSVTTGLTYTAFSSFSLHPVPAALRGRHRRVVSGLGEQVPDAGQLLVVRLGQATLLLLRNFHHVPIPGRCVRHGRCFRGIGHQGLLRRRLPGGLFVGRPKDPLQAARPR
ncbi:unnamed protein product, partial [Ixodes persulcatus]